MKRKFEDLTNQEHGNYKVIKYLGYKRLKGQKRPRDWYAVRCSNCYSFTMMSKYNILHANPSGTCKYCKDVKHGCSRTSEYKIWIGMKVRCYYQKHAEYYNYGGRGITVCERWKHFPNFLEDIGKRPSPKHSIERIDVNGNYCPENCEWVYLDSFGNTIQNQNKRNIKTYAFAGHQFSQRGWERYFGVKTDSLRGLFENNKDIATIHKLCTELEPYLSRLKEDITMEEISEEFQLDPRFLAHRVRSHGYKTYRQGKRNTLKVKINS